MSVPIVTFDEAAVRGEPRELVRQTAEDALNALLEEADDLVKAGRCERGLTTTSGRVTLRMPKPKGRGLSGVRMFTGDKAAAMAGAIAEVFPDAAYRRCTAHLHRSALSKAPKSKRAGAARRCSRRSAPRSPSMPAWVGRPMRRPHRLTA